MIETTPAFVAELEAAAIAAQQAEISFRQNISAEMTRRERERQFAFRRVGLIRQMVQAAAGAETEEQAVAAQAAALRRELGWHSTSDRRKQILEAWVAIAGAVWQAVHPLPEGEQTPASAGDSEAPSVARAIATFEAWYETEIGTPFFELLGQEMPEMPVVEF